MSIEKICGCFKKDPLFVIRIALGVAFIMHGATKLTDISGGMGFFSSVGLPGFVFVIVALVELIAGLGILLNKFAKYSAYSIAVVMLGAIVLVKLKAGYLGGYEMDVAYFAMAIAVAMSSCRGCSAKTCSVDSSAAGTCSSGTCNAEGHDRSQEEKAEN